MKNTYPINQSALYECHSKKKLAKLLNTNINTINDITLNLNDNYSLVEQKKKNGKVRQTYNPSKKLKTIQKRLHILLKYIELPEYVFSKKYNSHVGAAKNHCGFGYAYSLDIKDFFPSVKFEKIYSFFRYDLKCSQDVAYKLAKLSTYQNKLVQGSPASQCLAVLSNLKMIKEIYYVTQTDNLKLSIYVDDITISGERISKAVKDQVKFIIKKHGFNYHKEKQGGLKKGARIHNIMVKRRGIELPNSFELKTHLTTKQEKLRGLKGYKKFVLSHNLSND